MVKGVSEGGYATLEIPDAIVEQYARAKFSLMTADEAMLDYEPEPDEYANDARQ